MAGKSFNLPPRAALSQHLGLLRLVPWGLSVKNDCCLSSVTVNAFLWNKPHVYNGSDT